MENNYILCQVQFLFSIQTLQKIQRNNSLPIICVPECWRKNQHTGIRGQVFTESQKVNQACQTIWPEIDKGENKVKFESVLAGIPNISHTGVSAGSADTEDDKRIFKCGCVINERVGRISRCTKRQNRLWIADCVCMTRSKLRMCNSDDVS